MPTIVPVITKCNQNCLFCSAKDRKEKITLKWIYHLIEGEKKLAIISGGEPTLLKDLTKIIKYAKSRGLYVELQTNGVTLAYLDWAKRLVHSGVDLFNINFPSHLEDIDAQITQSQGFFRKRIRGIHNLEKLEAKIRLTHIINSINYFYLSDIIDFIVHEFSTISYIQFSFIKILGNARKYLYINPRYGDVKPFLLKAMKKCQKYKIDFMVDHIPICFLSGFEKYHVDFQKLKKGEEAVFSLSEKVKLSCCQRCKLKEYCFGVRKDYIELFGKRNVLQELKQNLKR